MNHRGADDGVGWVPGGGSMSSWSYLMAMVVLSRMLWNETAGIYRPKRRFLAIIDQYHVRTKKSCPVCQTNPAASFSHRVQAKAQRNLFAGIWMLLAGIIATAGPRDAYGWRRGGI